MHRPITHQPLPTELLEGSLLRLFSATRDRFPDHIAIESLYQTESSLIPTPTLDETGPLRWTYEELYSYSNQLACELKTSGLSSGQPLAVFIDNGAEWALLFWASLMLECPFVPLNAALLSQTSTLEQVLAMIRPGAVVVRDRKAAKQLHSSCAAYIADTVKIMAACPEPCPRGWLTVKSLLEAAASQGPPVPINSTGQSDQNANVVVMFDSDEAGLPRDYSHTNSTLVNISFSLAQKLKVRDNSRLLAILPFDHAYGLGGIIPFWASGATVVVPCAASNPEAAFRALDYGRYTHMNAAPDIVNQHPARSHRMPQATHHSSTPRADYNNVGAGSTAARGIFRVFDPDTRKRHGDAREPYVAGPAVARRKVQRIAYHRAHSAPTATVLRPVISSL